jgi:anti-anti-sigma factor
MSVTVTDHTPGGGVSQVAVDGRLDAYTVPEARACIDALMEPGVNRLVVDLSAVTFLDSAGLAMLVTALKRARQQGGDVKLVWPANENTQRILRLTRFDRVFDISTTVKQALERF